MKEVTLVMDAQVTVVLKGLTEEQAGAFERIGREGLRPVEAAMMGRLCADDVQLLHCKTFIRDENDARNSNLQEEEN